MIPNGFCQCGCGARTSLATHTDAKRFKVKGQPTRFLARARDRALAQYAEWVVEILIDMQAPGCQWLDLAPLEPAA